MDSSAAPVPCWPGRGCVAFASAVFFAGGAAHDALVQAFVNDGGGDADLARFAQGLRRRHVRSACLGAVAATFAVVVLPGMLLWWVWPNAVWAVLTVAAGLVLLRVVSAAQVARRVHPHALFAGAGATGLDAAVIAEVGDELATWLEPRPATAAAMRSWLAHDVRQKLPTLPKASVRDAGRSRRPRVLWLLPLAALLLLCCWLTDLLSPPWRGVLGGRASVPEAQSAATLADRLLAEVRAVHDDPLRGPAALQRLHDGDALVPTLTLATAADGALVAPDHAASGNVQKGEQWAWARQIAVERITDPGASGVLVTVRVFGRDAEGNFVERARTFELFPEPSGDQGNGDNSASSQAPPQPKPRQEPQPTPQPPPQDDTPQPEPETPQPRPPLLDLPMARQFLLPEFVADGPVRRARMHAAEVPDAGAGSVASGSGQTAVTQPPPPQPEQFERAAEAALRARHVPAAERAIVRSFFDALREARR